MVWNEEGLPDPTGAIREIHDLEATVMIFIWPSVGNDTDRARELDEKGLRHEPIHRTSGNRTARSKPQNTKARVTTRKRVRGIAHASAPFVCSVALLGMHSAGESPDALASFGRTSG